MFKKTLSARKIIFHSWPQKLLILVVDLFPKEHNELLQNWLLCHTLSAL